MTFYYEWHTNIGISHIKGILLYGPPGTGKTLIAREMAKALNSREPILINGPEIMDKYVGEAEKNIRDLFKPAEEEWATRGQESELHVIIFDEFDSVAKKRGSLSGALSSHVILIYTILSFVILVSNGDFLNMTHMFFLFCFNYSGTLDR